MVSGGELITLFLGLELLSFRPTCSAPSAASRFIRTKRRQVLRARLLRIVDSCTVWRCAGSPARLARIAGRRFRERFAAPGHSDAAVGFLFKVGAAPFTCGYPTSTRRADSSRRYGDGGEGSGLRSFCGCSSDSGLAAMPSRRSLVVGLHHDDRRQQSALTQDNIKRMLAFSSVAHAATCSWVSPRRGLRMGHRRRGRAFYLVAYIFMNVGAFTS